MALRVCGLVHTLPCETRLGHINLQSIHIVITTYMNLFACGQRFNVPSVAIKDYTVALVANTTYRHQWAMYVGHLGFECDFVSIFCNCHDMLFPTV